MDDIKRAIVARRLERIAVEGFTLGHPVPDHRQVPLIPFDRSPFVICEVKRRSPSKGIISGNLDAVAQARLYVESGIKTISVLTEEDQFGGSLQDLMDVKNAFPETAVLRKDFLVRREDLDVAWRAGADAVLLIASLLTAGELADLKAYAEGLGLAVFVELHDQADCDRARPLAPAFTGINCRDLGTFAIDRTIPLVTKAFVDWPTRLVFESGISRPEEAHWAASAGFQGILVGEGAVKDPTLARRLAHGFRPGSTHHPDPTPNFWARLYGPRRLADSRGVYAEQLKTALGSDLVRGSGGVYAEQPNAPAAEAAPGFYAEQPKTALGSDLVRGSGGVYAEQPNTRPASGTTGRYAEQPNAPAAEAARGLYADQPNAPPSAPAPLGRPPRPFVKICGLAHYDDLDLAEELGADLVGFILAPSKRQVDAAFVRHAPRTRALKVGVVVLAPGQDVPEEIAALVDEGHLDALQFHGREDQTLVDAWADRGYKALSLDGPESWKPWASAVAPRALVDAGTGGSGLPVPDDELAALAGTPFGSDRLWLAGGLTPDTVAAKIERWRPELIDASSGLEETPGRKDPAKLRRFFGEIERVT